MQLSDELGFYAEKKKWPKGMEEMPDLLKRAQAALSAQVQDVAGIRQAALDEAAKLVEEQWNHCWPSDIATSIREILAAPASPNLDEEKLQFPTELTDDLRDALSTMLWTSGQIAACLRAGGEVIKTRAEDEQAHVLHWLISLALKHGPEWRRKASDRIKAIRDAQAPTAEQEG